MTNFLFLKSSETYANKNSLISKQKKCWKKKFNFFLCWGLRPLRPQFVGSSIPHRRLRPQAPDCFGLNPASQLVIAYPWLAFLNRVLKNMSQFFLEFRVQMYHLSKKKSQKYPSCAILVIGHTFLPSQTSFSLYFLLPLFYFLASDKSYKTLVQFS